MATLPEWIQDCSDFCDSCLTRPTPRGKAADYWIEHGRDLVHKIEQQMARIAELEADVAEAEGERDGYAQALAASQTRQDAQAKRIARLEAALRPFAERYDPIEHDKYGDGWSTNCDLEIVAIRAAKAALEEAKNG